MIAIHHNPVGFEQKWVNYCKKNKIPFKVVSCYDNDIIDQLEDCDALMWHFHQSNPKDALIAKKVIYALQTAGKKVFPDFNTCWHFDDKLGQKYLLESIDAPLASSYVFFEKQDALKWISETEFPKVFKLRSGAGSAHVKLVTTKAQAQKLVNKAFGRGFSQYEKLGNLQERWYKYRHGKTNLWGLLKGVLRLGKTTEFARIAGPERGYIYFQDFIPGNQYDIRVTYVCGRCFAVRRKVRNNDFRASGSGNIDYDLDQIPSNVIATAFDIANKLKLQTAAFDFLVDNNAPVLIELSYCFGHDGIPLKMGYWDSDLIFHKEEFNPYGWMVQNLIEESEYIY